MREERASTHWMGHTSTPAPHPRPLFPDRGETTRVLRPSRRLTSPRMPVRCRPVRLVVDINVIVAAFRSTSGANNALLRHAAAGRVRLLCSSALFLGIRSGAGTSRNPRVDGPYTRRRRRCRHNHARQSSPSRPTCISGHGPYCGTPMTRRCSKVARNSGADAIVTHNVQDFEPARSLGIEIATPGEIVGRLEQ